MINEVWPGVFRVKIPLPDSPLKYLNSYIIPGQERNLVVDTGLNRPECLQAMKEALEELDIDPGRSDFFITHLHADHFALTTQVAASGSRIFFNRPEAEIIRTWDGWKAIVAYARLNGFPPQELESALHNHPGYKFGSEKIPELTLIEDGDTLAVGDFNFRCLATPGHSRGHTCLWEAEQRILLAGDHILDVITPNIQCWWENDDPLQNYLHSLEKVYALEVALVLPGHRRIIQDCRRRIDQLKEHHDERLQEIVGLLSAGSQTAFQIASQMTWDLDCDSWEEFPVAQKWFATGEAVAHLRFLEGKAAVARDTVGEVLSYRLLDSKAAWRIPV